MERRLVNLLHVDTTPSEIVIIFNTDLTFFTLAGSVGSDLCCNSACRNFVQLVFSGEDSGRVLKYNPATKETTVLIRNIQFLNGISLSKDGSFCVL